VLRIILTICCLLPSCSKAGEHLIEIGRNKRIQVLSGELVTLRPSAPSGFDVRYPADAVFEVLRSRPLDSDDHLLTFFPGKHRRIVVALVTNNVNQGYPDVTKVEIVVGESPPDPSPPDPGPEPVDPELSGIAEEVYKLAKITRLSRTVSKALAENYSTIGSRIAAVRSYTLEL